MEKRYATIGIAAAAFVAIMLAFSPRSQWPLIAALIAVTIVIFAGLMTPAVRHAARTRRRLFVLAGAGMLVLAAGALGAILTYPSAISADQAAYAVCALMLVGFLLIRLPSMAATTDRAIEAQKTVQAAGPPGSDRVDAIAEAAGALAEPLRRLTSFAQVVGPWLVAFCALPLTLEAFKPVAHSAKSDPGHALALILVLLGVLLGGLLILIVAGIQWSRFVATGRKPGWRSIPLAALWGWVWRLVIFGSIFRATEAIEPWLARRLPGAAPWALHAIAGAAVWALTVLATPFALSLTAAAVGQTKRAVEMRLRVLRAAGRGIYIGAAMLLAPFFVIDWLSDTFSGQSHGPVAAWVWSYVWLVAVFMTVTASAGYLGRLYAKAA